MENELKNEFNCFGFVIRELLSREDYFLIQPSDFIREIYKKSFEPDQNGNVALYLWRTGEFDPDLKIDGLRKLQHVAIRTKEDRFKSKLSVKGELIEHLINDNRIMNPYRITEIMVGKISADKETLSKFVESFAVCWCGSRKRYLDCHLQRRSI